MKERMFFSDRGALLGGDTIVKARTTEKVVVFYSVFSQKLCYQLV